MADQAERRAPFTPEAASIRFSVIGYLPEWKLKYRNTATRMTARPPAIAKTTFGLRFAAGSNGFLGSSVVFAAATRKPVSCRLRIIVTRRSYICEIGRAHV